MSKILLSVKYNTFTTSEVVIEEIEDYIANQDGVIREVDGTFSVEDVVKAVLISQKVYDKFGDCVILIKGYKYTDTLNLSRSNVLDK